MKKSNLFFLVPGVRTFENKSFHMAGHLTSNLVPGTGNLTNSDFKSSNAWVWPGGMLKFRTDRYKIYQLLELFYRLLYLKKPEKMYGIEAYTSILCSHTLFFYKNM